jgi:hypothetical protein
MASMRCPLELPSLFVEVNDTKSDNPDLPSATLCMQEAYI